MSAALDASLRAAQAHPVIGPALERMGVIEAEDLEACDLDELAYLLGLLDGMAAMSPRATATVSEAARVLGERPRTVRSWCTCGALPATRAHARAPWRIDREQLRAFAAELRVNG